MYPFIWQKQLDRLRKEQSPNRDGERPGLQLPIPEPSPPQRPPEEVERDEESESRVIIINF